MKLITVFITAILIAFGGNGVSSAQTDPCALEFLLTSFEAAALSDSVDIWVEQYEQGDCEANVIRSVRLMARSYTAYFQTSVTGVIPLHWANGTSRRISDGQEYTDISIDIVIDDDNQFEGTYQIMTPVGHYVLSISGEYLDTYRFDKYHTVQRHQFFRLSGGSDCGLASVESVGNNQRWQLV